MRVRVRARACVCECACTCELDVRMNLIIFVTGCRPYQCHRGSVFSCCRRLSGRVQRERAASLDQTGWAGYPGPHLAT